MATYKNVQLLVAGGTTELYDGDPYRVLKDQGLGMAPVRRITEQGPQQNGDTDLGFRLQARRFTLRMSVEQESRADFYTKREELLGLFAPYQVPKIRFTLQNDEVRQIDCYHVDDLDMPSEGRYPTSQDLGVLLRAADPTFYDPTAVSTNFNLGGGSDALEVPMEIPMVVGASTLDETKIVTNSGNWYGFPRIRITGPITNPIITNTTTGEKLDFTGTTISGGDYYDIDTRYGQKTVMDSSGTNRISKLTSDSDLATFKLLPNSTNAPGGINSIRVTGSAVSEDTDVTFTFFKRYLGI